jgi:hypothetical protein
VFGQARGSRRNITASFVGLAVAWGGTAVLVSPLARHLDEASRLPVALLGQVLVWALGALVVGIVLLWEGETLRSLWLQQFRWHSVAWGVLLVAVYYAMLFPIGEWVRRAAGLAGFGVGIAQLARFPIWYRVVAVVGAGVVEEILFRGFSVTRLAMLTGRTWLAAAVTLVVFYVLHVPVWDWGC